MRSYACNPTLPLFIWFWCCPDLIAAQDFPPGKELLAVSVVYRHGDRTPIDGYPNDPYKDPSYWPVGPGQLTPRGKKMHYQVGQYLRRRYGSILPQEYNENDIYVRSTDVDRTLMSALSNLAGLYPPKGDQVWNRNLLWQPIPVHTVPKEEDGLLSSHAKCPRFTQLYNELMQSDEIQAINKKYQGLYEYLSNHTGAVIDNAQEVDYVYDTLFIEEIYNFTLPEWTKNVYPTPMKVLRDLSFQLTTWTHELKRLRSGPLIQKLLDRAKNISNANSSNADATEPKMLMYSGHDTTLASFLNSLGMYEPSQPPPYASMILIEVFRDKDTKKIEVRFLFRNRTAPVNIDSASENPQNGYTDSDDDDTKPYVKYLLGECGEFCALEDFDSMTSDLRPQNWKAECDLSSDAFIQVVTMSSLIVTAFIFLILLFTVILACCKQRKDRVEEYNYLSINQDDADRGSP